MHHWRIHLAVIAGAAVATAVLTGALLVGDSVRDSLRQLTLERLGGVDHALAGQRFFRREVASRLAADPEFQERFTGVAPVILLQGGAQHADSRARASRVGLRGVDGGFLSLYAGAGETPMPATDFFAGGAGIFPPAVINQALAAALGAAVGDQILISLARWSEVPRGSLLGRKDTESVVGTVRLEVVRILPDRGLGRFALAAHQSSPFNAFVPLAALQKALDQEETVNGLVVAGDGEVGGDGLADLLRRQLATADLGLTVETGDGVVSITSQEYVLKPAVVDAVRSLAAGQNARLLPVSTYLANAIRAGTGEDAPAVPYSTVTATDVAAARAFGGIRLIDGSPAPALGDSDILINAWAAEQLELGPGDAIGLDFYQVTDREQLREATADFTVRGVVAIEGLAADAGLVQDYPGIAGSDDMAGWDPPFPIDLGLIDDRDEDYWDRYRGTPKAFVATDTGKRLWRSRWGELTATRVAPAEGGDPAALAETLSAGLLESLSLDAFGMAFEPVKRLGLEAATGSSDYGGYFLGFSFFLIASAAMLVALLFGLGVERRAAEVGLLRAVGYPARRVRRRLLAEGGVLAAIGAGIGIGGAVAYAGLMMAAARTWWRGAFGTSELYLHVTPLSLALGFGISVAVVHIAIWRRVRRLDRVSTPALLKRVSEPPDTRAGRRARWTAGLSLALAGALLVTAVATGQTRNAAIFGSAGPALLIGLLAAFALFLGGTVGGLRRPGTAALLRMAAANGARNRSRSILSATLVAAASFMIVTVAAFHEDFATAELGRDSGTGGYALWAESDVPILHDLDSREGRFELGVPRDAEAALTDARITALRLLPGDDTSCLNLYQPREPRLLGVPDEMIARGGFRFANMIQEAENPWTLLENEIEENVIPAIGDVNSTQYILKLGLGEDLAMENGHGEPIRLRLVANLKTSIFQSELLISQDHFERHFPDLPGTSVFLVETPAETSGEVTQVLESSLSAYGFDAFPTAEKLADFHAVQNTFLSTFRTLGGLGLLLGTVGLAIVLLRNVIERGGELAALRAFGFRRRTLTWMVLVENALLLGAGLAIGTVAALVTAGPHLLEAGSTVPWSQILGTLAGILLFGLLACAVTSVGALRVPLLSALKAEN